MPIDTSQIVNKAWNYAHVLRDDGLSYMAYTEQQVEHALQRAVRLRQSILKRAFEGKLVPQSPADKPAEKLLKQVSAGVETDAITSTSAPTRKRGRTRVIT